MAHLWLKNESSAWALLALEGEAYGLLATRPVRLPAIPGDVAESCALALWRVGAGADCSTCSTWALLSRPNAGVTINGLPARLGLVMLVDRDEIRTPGLGPLFFSTELLAHVVPFPASGPRVFCARCKDEICAGNPAVTCPRCGLWHHQSEDRPCWAYASTCAVCPQETALDAGFRWTPEDL